MKQRTTEWLDKNKVDTDYNEKQFKEPYRSTVAFCNWIETIGLINNESKIKVLDLCSGAGANIYYMSQRYPKSFFVGVDINADLVEQGNAFFRSNGISNCSLETGDIFNLDLKYLGFNGLVSFQTLSWLPEFTSPIQSMTKLAPEWIALTSLFYDGQISCTIEVTEYDDLFEPHRSMFYNIYSLPVVKKCLQCNGYPILKSTSFEIDIDLPKLSKSKMATYTEKLEDGHRLQISGPLLMPWYFISARKSK